MIRLAALTLIGLCLSLMPAKAQVIESFEPLSLGRLSGIAGSSVTLEATTGAQTLQNGAICICDTPIQRGTIVITGDPFAQIQITLPLEIISTEQPDISLFPSLDGSAVRFIGADGRLEIRLGGELRFNAAPVDGTLSFTITALVELIP
jgi:hypothetical protein